MLGTRVYVLAVPFCSGGATATAGGDAYAVYPAKFIAVWEELKPRDAAVVPLAKLPSVIVSANANDADAASTAPRAASFLKFIIKGLPSTAKTAGLRVRCGWSPLAVFGHIFRGSRSPVWRLAPLAFANTDHLRCGNGAAGWLGSDILLWKWLDSSDIAQRCVSRSRGRVAWCAMHTARALPMQQ